VVTVLLSMLLSAVLSWYSGDAESPLFRSCEKA